MLTCQSKVHSTFKLKLLKGSKSRAGTIVMRYCALDGAKLMLVAYTIYISFVGTNFLRRQGQTEPMGIRAMPWGPPLYRPPCHSTGHLKKGYKLLQNCVCSGPEEVSVRPGTKIFCYITFTKKAQINQR